MATMTKEEENIAKAQALLRGLGIAVEQDGDNVGEKDEVGGDIREKLKKRLAEVNKSLENRDNDEKGDTSVVERKPRVKAEELARDALEAAKDKWIVYNEEETSLDNWLKENKPSQIMRSSGVGWISVVKPGKRLDEMKKFWDQTLDKNLDEMKTAWDQLTNNNPDINIDSVQSIAKRFSVTSGKWLLHLKSDRVDIAWERVARALVNGDLGPNVDHVKVSPVADTDDTNHDHVICVITTDFTDEQQVFQVETSVRQLRVRARMQYKPEIFTSLGIYRNNRWGLRPTIYHSTFSLKEGKSVIESAFENTWFYNTAKGFLQQPKRAAIEPREAPADARPRVPPREAAPAREEKVEEDTREVSDDEEEVVDRRPPWLKKLQDNMRKKMRDEGGE